MRKVHSLSNIVFALAKGDKTLWDIPAEEQKIFLDSLTPPKDDIQRSFYQYKCQCIFVPKWKRLSRGILAAIAIPFIIIIALIDRLFVKREVPQKIIGQFFEYQELIPDELSQMFLIKNSDWGKKMALSIKDVLFIIKHLCKYIYKPYFCFKCIWNLAKYRYYIHKYSPEIIADHAEFSCTSSFLTHYCNWQGIKHYNVMHGEKLFYIRDSFFRYDKCYVWDEFYKKLFIELKAEDSQFVIEYPKSIVNLKNKTKKPSLYVDYRYYLQVPTIEQMKGILKSMEFARKQGKTVKYRLHPNHMDIEAVSIIPEDEIENPREIDILDSMVNSGCIIGSYTTTLTHAYFAGLNVVLDDVTYNAIYKKLNRYRYILASKNIRKLSDFYEKTT